MSNTLLYLATIVIWGTSWLAIKYQLGVVAPQVSVFYRFMIAAVLLLLFCLLSHRKLGYGTKDHLRFGFIGLFLFNLNYISIYYASAGLTTGLISVVFSSVQIFNIIIGYLVLKEKATLRMLLGAGIGMAGIILVFSPEISALDRSDKTLQAIGLTFLGTLFASIGMISSASFQRQNYPVLQTNAWGMTWGSVWMLVYILLFNIEFSFDFRPGYIGSLIWLTVFSTVFAFGFFLTLVGRIGAARASYAMVIFPIVALLLSTWFEGYQWGLIATLGLGLAIIGNIVILLDKQKSSGA